MWHIHDHDDWWDWSMLVSVTRALFFASHFEIEYISISCTDVTSPVCSILLLSCLAEPEFAFVG